jgi:hypothetical protein
VDVDLLHLLHVDVVVATCLTEVAGAKLHVYKIKVSLLVEGVLPEQLQQVAYRFIDVTGVP